MGRRILEGDSNGDRRDVEARPASRLTRVSDGLAITFAALLSAALAFLAMNEPWVSDDFSNALFIREHPGLWDCLWGGYATWSGRFSSSAFSWVAMQIRPMYGIFIWLGLMLLVVMTFALARGRLPRAERADLYVLGLLLAAYWFAMPAINETVFWASGSAVYLWPAVATLIFLYQFRRWEPGAPDPGSSGLRRVAYGTVMFVLGVWVGASQEQVLVASLLFLVILAVRAARAGSLGRMPAALYSGVAGLVIAGALDVIAPGNGARVAAVPSVDVAGTAVSAAKYLGHILVEWLPPLAPWLLCIGLLALPIAYAAGRGGRGAAVPTVARPQWWVWVLLGLATLSPLLAQPYFGAERTVMYLAVFLAVAAVSLAEEEQTQRSIDRLPAVAASSVLGLVLLAAACGVGLSGWQARTLKAAQEQRSEDIARQKAGGERNVSVPPITDDIPRRGVIWGDGTADPAFWVNGILASYYEVETVVVTEVPATVSGNDR